MSENSDNLPILHVDIVEYPQDKTFVAECIEVPIIVEAETFDKVEEMMHLAMTGYFETFPDERLTVLTSRRMSIPPRPVVEESGGRHLIHVPFPRTNWLFLSTLSGHNWHQIVAVLEHLGYSQVRDYSNEILYYQNKKNGIIFGFRKSNNMTGPYLLTILRRLELQFDEFVRIYQEKLEPAGTKT